MDIPQEFTLEFADRLEQAKHRHMLGLLLEKPTEEILISRCALLGALLDEALIQLRQAVDQKKTADWMSAMAMEIIKVMPTQIESQEQKKRAAKRHSVDPKQRAKQFVRECWNDWQANPEQYGSQAAFARAMLEKVGVDVGGSLESVATITNKWIPEFRKASRS